MQPASPEWTPSPKINHSSKVFRQTEPPLYTVPYLIALISVWIIVALTPDLALILLPNR